MKSTKLAALSILAASLGMGATPQTLPYHQSQNQSQKSQQQKHNDGLDKQIVTVRRGAVTPLNPAGINGIEFDYGTPPKQYGQWLQSTRRQKWTKSKRK